MSGHDCEASGTMTAIIRSVPIHRSALLGSVPGLIHGVSMRIADNGTDPFCFNLSTNVGDDPVVVGNNRREFFSTLGVNRDSVAFTRQVHGETIVNVRAPALYQSTDALWTQRPGMSVTVSVADCVPILMYDPVTRIIAAVHAGWQGSLNGIAGTTVRRLAGETRLKPENVIAYIGPSAGACCYEVGEDVAREFHGRYYRETGIPGKYLLDLKAVNRDLLTGAGLRPANIETAPECTICSSGRFHSYRRDGARSGRMLALICIGA